MALLSAVQFARRNPKLTGTAFRDAYWQYRADNGSPVPGSPQASPTPAPAAPVVTPRPGPAPGALDARGEEDLANLNEWRDLEAADIDASEGVNRLNYEDATRRAETDRNENIRRTIASYGARGLLRSGLRAQGEARVEGGHVDLLTALGRRWSEAQSSAQRARDRLASTFEQRKGDVSRSAWDRLVAEFEAGGGSTVTPGTPPPSAATPSPASSGPGTARPRPGSPITPPVPPVSPWAGTTVGRLTGGVIPGKSYPKLQHPRNRAPKPKPAIRQPPRRSELPTRRPVTRPA